MPAVRGGEPGGGSAEGSSAEVGGVARGEEAVSTFLEIVVPGDPVAQGRPRVAVVKGKPRVYSPKVSSDWRATAQWWMKTEIQKAGLPIFSGPVALDILACFALPKSKFKKKAKVEARWKTSKPDFDNVAKAVCDAGNGILFLDDAQVVDVRVRKFHAKQGEGGFLMVRVSEAGEL